MFAAPIKYLVHAEAHKCNNSDTNPHTTAHPHPTSFKTSVPMTIEFSFKTGIFSHRNLRKKGGPKGGE